MGTGWNFSEGGGLQGKGNCCWDFDRLLLLLLLLLLVWEGLRHKPASPHGRSARDHYAFTQVHSKELIFLLILDWIGWQEIN